MSKNRTKIVAVLLPAAALPVAFGVGSPTGMASAADCEDGITLATHYLSVGDYVTGFRLVGYLLLDIAERGARNQATSHQRETRLTRAEWDARATRQ